MKELCRFCDIVTGISTKEEDQLVLESEEYFSIASIGALVEGWVLASPKAHLVSMKNLYNDEEFVVFVNNLLALMTARYDSSIIAFEHGPNKCGSDTSCGTNHAHLHFVPYMQSLFSDMVASGLSWEQCRTTQIASIVGDNEYLFYCDISRRHGWDNPVGYIHVLSEPTSQYFRRIIANQLNRKEEYNYKTYPFRELAILTSNALQNKTTNC